jgi:hypothetical protein
VCAVIIVAISTTRHGLRGEAMRLEQRVGVEDPCAVRFEDHRGQEAKGICQGGVGRGPGGVFVMGQRERGSGMGRMRRIELSKSSFRVKGRCGSAGKLQPSLVLTIHKLFWVWTLASTMSVSRWSLYMGRTGQMMKEGVVKSTNSNPVSCLSSSDAPLPVLTMSGVDEPSRAPKMLYTFNSQSSLQDYANGCDADTGGTSTVHLTLDESGPKPTAKFWGKMRLAVRPEFQGRVQGGFAGFRSKVSNIILFDCFSAKQTSSIYYIVSNNNIRRDDA